MEGLARWRRWINVARYGRIDTGVRAARLMEGSAREAEMDDLGEVGW
jgi:hypothetical protein